MRASFRVPLAGHTVGGAFALIAVLCAIGCEPAQDRGAGSVETRWSAVQVGLQVAPGTDVSAIYFDASCADGFATQALVPLEEEGLPPWIAPGLGGHPFADFLFLAPVGSCTVTGQAQTAAGLPSAVCSSGAVTVDVAAGSTVEAVLVIPCEGPEVGAIDAVGALNFAPVLTSLEYLLGPQISTCVEGQVVATVEDPEGGPVSTSWDVVTAPPGADYAVFIDGLTVSIIAATPGLYVIALTAIDTDGGQMVVDVPFFVSINTDPQFEGGCDPQSGCYPGKCDDANLCTFDVCEDGACFHSTLEEVCDDADNDCDGVIDNGCACPQVGDVNGSGVTNVADAQCTLLVILWNLGGQAPPAPKCLGGASPLVADADCNGVINVSDVVAVIRLALGLGPGPALDADGDGCADACELDSCGSGICEPEEDCASCPLDCGPCGGG